MEVQSGQYQLVQELSKSGQGPPAHFILQEDIRPNNLSAPKSASLPVVDFSCLFKSGSLDEEEALKLHNSLKSWGMVWAVGHEISPSLLDELRNVSTKFFQLPKEPTLKCKSTTTRQPEGFGPDPPVTKNQIYNWCDRLFLLLQPEEKRSLDLWPENPSSFREILHQYSVELQKIFGQSLTVLAKLLDMNEDFFSKQLGEEPLMYARFNYYPACSRPDLVFGLKPHSDGSAITVLLPDKDVEGLQVLKDEEWITVSPHPEALLLVLGDGIEIMTNGIFKSPVHRVVTNSEKERMSLTVFYFMDPEAELGPADALVDESHPSLYKKMKFKEYVAAYEKNLLVGKIGIDCAKI